MQPEQLSVENHQNQKIGLINLPTSSELTNQLPKGPLRGQKKKRTMDSFPIRFPAAVVCRSLSFLEQNHNLRITTTTNASGWSDRSVELGSKISALSDPSQYTFTEYGKYVFHSSTGHKHRN